MKRAFGDTFFFIALLNPRDSYHRSRRRQSAHCFGSADRSAPTDVRRLRAWGQSSLFRQRGHDKSAALTPTPVFYNFSVLAF